MSDTQFVTITNMCMIYHGESVLVLDKVHSDRNGVTFPGGHVKKRESFTDAVIREVFEETGLTVRSPRLCGIKDWINDDGSRYMVLLYKTDKFEGEIRSSDEGEVYWTRLETLPALELAADMEDMLKVFSDDDLSEFFYRKIGERWVCELM